MSVTWIWQGSSVLEDIPAYVMSVDYLQRIPHPHISHSSMVADSMPNRCLKILLVADPQILGNTFDKKIYWPLANFDSDWHLSKTYRKAVQHTTPDVICFLGDLMDEGSVATAVQYDEYYARFANIFTQPRADTLMIYIPGDNDIGGEGQLVTQENVQRFRQYFSEKPNWELIDTATFINVNRFTGFMPSTEKTNHDQHSFTVLLSHMSLLKNIGTFSERAIQTFHPHVIFSAHDHLSKYALVHRNNLFQEVNHIDLNTDRHKRQEISSFNLVDLRYRQELLEIMVPTCSYRMGVMKIGYGYAVLDGDELKYTVLWSSQRFYQLAVYSLMIIPLKLLCGQVWCTIFKRYWCCCRPRNRSYLPLHNS
ncbi:uncharacterized protein LOC134216527 isoform X2 [Armigeres subalbatus]|uniref:uncharacterized protein LOC134216527 isoform X2 n=1 Tax=Armigeres subalbatus TaxID=124917 RepID=UPI002ED5F80C